MARKRGRPTKYKKIYAKKILKFFAVDPFQEFTLKKINKNGDQIEETVLKPVLLPTITDFSETIGVDETTIKNWANAKYKSGKPKHPEFFESYRRSKALQKNIWIKLSLVGEYNPNFAGLVGKNMFGWKDKSEVEAKHSGNLIVKRVSYQDVK